MKRKREKLFININSVTFYFPLYTYNDGKTDEFIGTPLECYDFGKKELQEPFKLRELKPEILPIVPSTSTFDSFTHISNLLTAQKNLERSGVLGMINAHVLESIGNENPSKLLFETWRSVSRKTLRDYIQYDARGVKRNFITTLVRLRQHHVLNYNDVFNRILYPGKEKENVYGLRHIPVGYVTPDANILRQYLWSYKSMEMKNGFIVQKYDHRRVAIFYDLHEKTFIVKVYPEDYETIYFDNKLDEDIVSVIGNKSPEYKQMEIKVNDNEIDNYKPERTRVFNFEKFTRENTFMFSLEKFKKRNRNRVSLTVNDNDMNNVNEIQIYPVNYTLLIYSIVKTWLHSYSEYFEEYLITETKPYFQCYYDKLMGMFTNTYVLN